MIHCCNECAEDDVCDCGIGSAECGDAAAEIEHATETGHVCLYHAHVTFLELNVVSSGLSVEDRVTCTSTAANPATAAIVSSDRLRSGGDRTRSWSNRRHSIISREECALPLAAPTFSRWYALSWRATWNSAVSVQTRGAKYSVTGLLSAVG